MNLIKLRRLAVGSLGLVVILTGLVSAQKVRLRSNANPQCTVAAPSPLDRKFSDIGADGHVAVQGSSG